MDINTIIGNGIRFYRKKLNINQDDLAAKLNISRTSVVQYENGKQAISIDMLIHLCDVLNIKIENIMSTKIIESYKNLESCYDLNNYSSTNGKDYG